MHLMFQEKGVNKCTWFFFPGVHPVFGFLLHLVFCAKTWFFLWKAGIPLAIETCTGLNGKTSQWMLFFLRLGGIPLDLNVQS
jgi:hypothetical protein